LFSGQTAELCSNGTPSFFPGHGPGTVLAGRRRPSPLGVRHTRISKTRLAVDARQPLTKNTHMAVSILIEVTFLKSDFYKKFKFDSLIYC